MNNTKVTPLGGRTWLALVIFGLFGQIAWTVENMYFNVFLYNTICGDTAMIAAMVAASAVTATLTTLVMGSLSDSMGRRKLLIVAGYILWGFSTMSFGLISAESVGRFVPVAQAASAAAMLVVLLDCVMTFFGSTANDAAMNAWVTDVTDGSNRGRVETVLAVMPLVAMLIVFGLLDPLTAQGKWNLFFFVVGALVIVGGIVGLFVIREPEIERKNGSFADIVHGLRPSVVRENPRLYLALAGLALYSASQQVYMPYLIIYIQRFLGIENYALVLGVVLVVSSVVCVLFGRVIDRAGKLRVAVPAAGVALVGLVLMYFGRGMLAVMLFGIVMLGGSMVVSACFQGLIRDHTPEGRAGQFQGIRIIFQVLLPMVTGPYIGSAVIRGTGMTYVDLGTVKQVPTAEIFLASAAVLLLIIIPIILMRKRGVR